MNSIAAKVYEYWFGSEPITVATAQAQAPLWWQGRADTDYDIERRFGKLVSMAKKGAFREWLEQPQSAVALVILNDQFPRNLHRGSASVFAQDALAREYSAQIRQNKVCWSQLNPLEKTFALMPLKHSENLEDQQECVRLFELLAEQSGAEWQGITSGFLNFAKQHHDIVAQFGRFPHRNEAMGRESTAEELAYLSDGGARFGQ